MANQKVSNEESSKKGKSTNNNPRRKKSNQYRGRQGSKDSRSKRVNDDNERVSKVKEGVCNDVSWYARNPEMLAAAASLPAYSVVGDRVPLNGANVTVPGAMAVYWDPVFAGANSDAVNQAKDSLYSFQVHANSRNQSYDSADNLNVILAGTNVFTTISHVIRAFGVAKQYSELNRYMPESLLVLMGFDPKDVINNLSAMWFDINQLIAQTSQLWIPNTMPLFTRQYWMNTNVYTDAESPKAQMYLYVPDHFYVYDPVALETGGIIRQVLYSDIGMTGTGPISISNVNQNSAGSVTGALTWSQWKALIQFQLDALIKDQDRGIIFGDILKAFGSDKIHAISPVSVDYRTPIVYEREVLMQIENATISAVGVVPAGIKQNQVTEKMEMLWYLSGNTQFGITGPSILNFHGQTAPSPADIMVATRLHAGPCTTQSVNVVAYTDEGITVSSKAILVPESIGTEFVTKIKVAKTVYNMNGAAQPTVIDFQTVMASGSPDAAKLSVFKLWAPFDWAPWLYIVNISTNVVVDVTGEFDMYIVTDNVELNKMHTAAVYSEYGVPYI